jgi:hypothetical protein
MSSINSLYIKKSTLEVMVKALEQKNKDGVEITISIADEPNQFEQNVSAYVSQSKEDRESKKPRYYIGNGNTMWTDGVIKTVKKEMKAKEINLETDLPF